MSKYKIKGFGATYRHALKGLRLVIKSERNIRVHFVATIIVIAAAIVLEFSAIEFSILILTIAMVIVTEMLNSAIEYSLDSIFKNRFSRLVGMAKDIAAGAVMIATYTSVAVGIFLFGSKIIELLGC